MINKTPLFSKDSFLKRGVLLITTVDYRLLVGLGARTSFFYAPDALSYWWATNCRRVALGPQITVFWAASPPNPHHLQAFGWPG